MLEYPPMSQPPEGDRPVPSAMRAFDSVPKNFRVRTREKLDALPQMQRRDAITAHILAGMAYLAGYPDTYLGGIARSVSETLTAYRSRGEAPTYPIAVTDGSVNIVRNFQGEEVSRTVGKIVLPRLDVQRTLLEEVQQEEVPTRPEPKMAVVFLAPPSFVVAAETPDSSRIDALGQLAFVASKFRSIVDDHISTYPDLAEQWAKATEAHFYNLVKLQPGVELSDAAREVAEQYPNGIFSLPLESRPPGYNTIDKRII
jgi:hypothetical protein